MPSLAATYSACEIHHPVTIRRSAIGGAPTSTFVIYVSPRQCLSPSKSVELPDRVQVRDGPRFLMPNAGAHLLPEAGAQRTR